MATIRSLLNPAPEPDQTSESDADKSSGTKHYAHDDSFLPPTRKKQKLCKDAVIFSRGPVRGECRYPPHEFQDEVIAAQHQRFEVFPVGEIADYPRHIPYNSEKKFFFGKTGRESLEVFQYSFKVPGDDTQYAMLWDYNIGLVRTTPLFKCTGHSKTTPAKMLNRNPGLREICHSITGGALVAQGYWMPYEAAKAAAATFCFNIRYALTPVFGTDFPTLCVPPNSDRFGEMTIDPAVIQRCAEQANLYRELEGQSTAHRQPCSSTPTTPLTPDTPTHPRNQGKRFQPKTLQETISHDYLSDTESDDSHRPLSALSTMTTPEHTFRTLWTPANVSRPSLIPRSAPSAAGSGQVSRMFLLPQLRASGRISSPEVSPKTRPVTSVDKLYDSGDDSSDDSEVTDDHNFCSCAMAKDVVKCQDSSSPEKETEKVMSSGLPNEENAACLLMSLRLQAATSRQECEHECESGCGNWRQQQHRHHHHHHHQHHRGKKRRASA